MSVPYCILVIDHEPSVRNYLQTILGIASYHVETAATGIEALERLQKGPIPDLVVLDTFLQKPSGLDVLKQIRQVQPDLEVIVLSGAGDTRTVIKAIELGAHGCISKPIRQSELERTVRHVLKGPDLSEDGPSIKLHIEDVGDNVSFVFASKAMERIFEQASLIASIDDPVLLVGERGTGKRVVAQLIHKLSRRAEGPFIRVNCAEYPAELLEGELFGYEGDATTSATNSKRGKFELADKGTILLEEIDEMPSSLQANLLPVLEDQQSFRLGGRSLFQVDARILAATRLNAEEAIASKRIRPEVYYRLSAFTIRLPPLRERQEEIPLLMEHFMVRFAAQYGWKPLPLSGSLMKSATAYSWPGNLGELSDFIKNYLLIGDEGKALRDLQAPQNETSRQSIFRKG